MTKEKLDELIERSTKFIEKSIPVKEGENIPNNNNPFIDHIFKSVGNTVLFKDPSGIISYEVNGILESPNKKIVNTISLWSIVNYFESQK